MDSVKTFFVPATVRSNLDCLIKGISNRGFIQKWYAYNLIVFNLITV